jgi:hypothetical protein
VPGSVGIGEGAANYNRMFQVDEMLPYMANLCPLFGGAEFASFSDDFGPGKSVSLREQAHAAFSRVTPARETHTAPPRVCRSGPRGSGSLRVAADGVWR